MKKFKRSATRDFKIDSDKLNKDPNADAAQESEAGEEEEQRDDIEEEVHFRPIFEIFWGSSSNCWS